MRMWKKYGAARQATDDIIRRMRFASWIIKATHTLKLSSTYCFSTAKIANAPQLYVMPALEMHRRPLMTTYLGMLPITVIGRAI